MIDDATKEVVYRDYIDISVAVATPRVCWGESWKCLPRSCLSYFCFCAKTPGPGQPREGRVLGGFGFRGLRVHGHRDTEGGSRRGTGASSSGAELTQKTVTN